jgi:L-fuconolactonase
MTIDAHQHFWHYDPVQYDWIDDRMDAIRRDFLPPDLKAEIEAVGVDGVVSVQARQTLEETDWLIALAQDHSFLRGVVGWVPLAADHLGDVLDRYTAHPVFKGVRHVVQTEAPGFLDHPAFNRGIRQLTASGITYDLLIVEHQLDEATRLVDRHPDQRFILDHLAKPKIRNLEIEPWKSGMAELARRDNVVCKLSGMVTEADWEHRSVDALWLYVDVALEVFGPQRLLFGSDWPVCLVAARYSEWYEVARAFTASLSESERSAIFGENAERVYGLESSLDR